MSIHVLHDNTPRYCVQPILPLYRGNNKYHRFPMPGGRSANDSRPVTLGDSQGAMNGASTPTGLGKGASTPVAPVNLAPFHSPYNNAGGIDSGALGVGNNRDVWM